MRSTQSVKFSLEKTLSDQKKHNENYLQGQQSLINFLMLILQFPNGSPTSQQVKMAAVINAVIEKLDVKSLYNLINQNVFLYLLDKTSLGKRKEEIFDYIKTFPLPERKEAFQKSLISIYPLYDFFAIQRGFFKTSLSRGTFAKIKKELDKYTKDLEPLIEEAVNKILDEHLKQMTDNIQHLIRPMNIQQFKKPLVFNPSNQNYTISSNNATFFASPPIKLEPIYQPINDTSIKRSINTHSTSSTRAIFK